MCWRGSDVIQQIMMNMTAAWFTAKRKCMRGWCRISLQIPHLWGGFIIKIFQLWDNPTQGHSGIMTTYTSYIIWMTNFRMNKDRRTVVASDRQIAWVMFHDKGVHPPGIKTLIRNNLIDATRVECSSSLPHPEWGTNRGTECGNC